MAGPPRTLLISLLVALVVLLPPAAAQRPVSGCSQQCQPQNADVNDPPLRREGPVNVVLWARFFHSWLDRAPLTVEPPDPDEEPDLNAGPIMPTFVTHVNPLLDSNFRAFPLYLVPAAGAILRTAEGSIHQHFLPCVAQDARWAPGPLVLYTYFSPEASPSSSVPAHAGALAGVRFEAAWESVRGSDGPRTLLAAGATETALLATAPGQPPVYEIRIPLDRTDAPMPPCRDHEPNQTLISLWGRQVDTDAAEVVQPGWRLRTGATYPWRLIVPLEGPLWTDGVASTFMNDTWALRWNVTGALSAFDVDLDTMRLTLRGPGDEPLATHAPDILRRSDAHGDYFRAARATWLLDADDLAFSGPLVAELSAKNAQGTYELVERVPVPPPLAPAADLPGALLLEALAGALASLGLLPRRAT